MLQICVVNKIGPYWLMNNDQEVSSCFGVTDGLNGTAIQPQK